VAYSVDGTILAVRHRSTVLLYKQRFQSVDALNVEVLGAVDSLAMPSDWVAQATCMSWASHTATGVHRLVVGFASGVKVLDIDPGNGATTITSVKAQMPCCTAVGWQQDGMGFLAGFADGSVWVFCPPVGTEPPPGGEPAEGGGRFMNPTSRILLKGGYRAKDVDGSDELTVLAWPDPLPQTHGMIVTGVAWLGDRTFVVCHTGTTMGMPLEEDMGPDDDESERPVVLQTATFAEWHQKFAVVSKIVSGHADSMSIKDIKMASSQFACRIPDWDYYSKWRTDRNPMTPGLAASIKSCVCSPLP
jgi:hypothetical protein